MLLVILLPLFALQSFLFEFGKFLKPRGISISPTGEIYIADTGNNSVKKFSEDGKLLAQISGYGWGELEFDEPYDVDASAGIFIYVADYNNHRIQRFDRNLNFIASYKTLDQPDAGRRFGFPRSVAISKLGDLFIIDGENLRCLKVNKFNRVEKIFGGVESTSGRLNNPIQISISPQNLIFILDGTEVKVYDYFGTYIGKLNSQGLKKPSGIFASDFIFVADGENVFVFDQNGKILKKLDFDFHINDVAYLNSKLYCLGDSVVRVYKVNIGSDEKN